ncbi:uncharacterized protein [Taeniopygia guttata]|uniref:uncharacterized protein n=1 Tax=Taeniopygia guttata TaxID=59729 RepID=UPI003BB8C8E6
MRRLQRDAERRAIRGSRAGCGFPCISLARELPAGSTGDALPAAPQVPRGVRRAPGGRGCSRRRARSPTRRGSRGTSTGPQLPLAASSCPPQGERPPRLSPSAATPRSARSGAHTVSPQKSPAKPNRGGGTAAPGAGTGLGRRHTATRAVPRLNTRGVNGIVAPVKLSEEGIADPATQFGGKGSDSRDGNLALKWELRLRYSKKRGLGGYCAQVTLFGRGTGPYGWVGPQGPSRAAELLTVPNRAGPGQSGRRGPGRAGQAALGGAAAARSPWAAAGPRGSRGAPGQPRCHRAPSPVPTLRPLIGLLPSRLPSKKRLGNGRSVRVKAGDGGFKAKKTSVRNLEIGFGRRFSGGYFGRRSQQTFRVSQGARFPGRRTHGEPAAGGNPAAAWGAAPRSHGAPAARLGGRRWTRKWTDGWMSTASEQ